MEDTEKIHVKKQYYTISEKLTILRKYHSKDHKTLDEWFIKENLFKNFPNNQSRKSMTLGKKTTFTEEEQNHIINFVE